MSTRTAAKGDVAWHLPDGKGGFRKRPFAYSTTAESSWMRQLAAWGCTFKQGYARCQYAPTEKELCGAFIDAGYGDRYMSEFIR